METLTLTEKQLQKLKRLPIDAQISNKEANIYQMNSLPKHKVPRDTLFKHLHILDKESFANKLFTVSMLSDYEAELNIKELVIPKELVSINGKAVGFTIPEIKNATNLGIILHDNDIPMTRKLELLKKVGELLSKVQKLEKYGIHFYFSDLHEYNFLVDNETDELYAIDLDSAALTSDYPQSSFYMISNQNLGYSPNKYKSNVFGITYPNHNTDLLCYNMMVIDTIAAYRISSLPSEEYYDYLAYLKELGFGQNIIDAFLSVYTNGENKNVSEFFDEIPSDMLVRARYNVYKALNHKNKR